MSNAFKNISSLVSEFDDRGDNMSNIRGIREYIHTGNYLLNACISGSIFRGYPGNRLVSFAGEPQTGKTFLCLNAAKQFQDKGYYVIFVDSENAIEPEQVKKFGIDLEGFRHVLVGTFKEAHHYFERLATTFEKHKEDNKLSNDDLKTVVILDSLNQLATEKEIEDVQKNETKQDFTPAREIRKLFRLTVSRFANLEIPMIYTNQVYNSMNAYGDPRAIKGGDGAIYPASFVGMLSKAYQKDSDKQKTGVIITVNPFKSRLTIPSTVKIHVSFTEGMNPYVGLQDYVSWDVCGIGRGKLEKLKKKEMETYDPNDDKIIEMFNEETGELEEVYRFEPNPNARNFVIKHLCDTVPTNDSKGFFNPKVFNDVVLEKIDEKAIKPKFEFEDFSESFELDVDEIKESDEPEE
jgi:RecA/RadA recombinase